MSPSSLAYDHLRLSLCCLPHKHDDILNKRMCHKCTWQAKTYPQQCKSELVLGPLTAWAFGCVHEVSKPGLSLSILP